MEKDYGKILSGECINRLGCKRQKKTDCLVLGFQSPVHLSQLGTPPCWTVVSVAILTSNPN